MEIAVSHGEVIDKHTILVIKSERIVDVVKLEYINKELRVLAASVSVIYKNVSDQASLHHLAERLKAVNEQLWDVEDALRVYENHSDFGLGFIEKARSVYFLNDDRAAIKKSINVLTKSILHETKSYEDYSNSGNESVD